MVAQPSFADSSTEQAVDQSNGIGAVVDVLVNAGALLRKDFQRSLRREPREEENLLNQSVEWVPNTWVQDWKRDVLRPPSGDGDSAA